MSEKDLISGCLRQDPLSQHQLYKLYGARVLGICKRYMKDRERAEEMAMNTFVTVFAKIGQFKGDGNFSGWILKIAVNHCLMELRKKNPFRFGAEIEDVHVSVEAAVMRDFETDDVSKMLLVLPEGARLVFNLFAIEGYKHHEIAEMLNISEGTSKSQLNYAKEKLKKLLAEAQSKKMQP